MSETVKAEKGFPIPLTGHARYPWESMKVGDSFPINVTQPWTNASQANKRYKPKKFRPGKAEDGSIRIWRIS